MFEYICEGLRLREINLLNAAIKAFEMRLLTSSMWTPLVTKHTKIEIYAFFRVSALAFTYRYRTGVVNTAVRKRFGYGDPPDRQRAHRGFRKSRF